MRFRNKYTGEIISLREFVDFVWEESERQFDECSGELWCNLTRDEQLEIYCNQCEYQVLNGDWRLIYNEKENN